MKGFRGGVFSLGTGGEQNPDEAFFSAIYQKNVAKQKIYGILL
jgi:hypothetical protein